MKQAIILAAGLGSRLRPLSNKIPKPLLKIQEQSLISRHLRSLSNVGITEIFINVHHLAFDIISEIGSGEHYGVNITYSIEDPLLETAGALIKINNWLDSNIIIISADIYTDFNYGSLAIPNGSKGMIVLNNCQDHQEGDFGISGHLAVKNSKVKYNYANIAILNKSCFAGYPSGNRKLVEIFDDLIEQKQLAAKIYRGLWHNVGTLEKLKQLDLERYALG